LYSNGLRIEKEYLAPARLAEPFQRWRRDNGRREEAASPFGIVFHTTESDGTPYEEDNRALLQRVTQSVLRFVKARRCYHYLIDRFGRVYRTVAENEPANHAGRSVWADDDHFYVNLNYSFLGIAFEGRSKGADGQPTATESQFQSAALLTALLRSRYRIPAINCVTHGQVSVNPSNMGIGYHTDWSAGFPFKRLGLTVNYLRPLPAITLFGFRFDDMYANGAGEELQDGVSAGETILRQEAARRNLSPAAYRRLLAQRYRSVADPHERIDFSEPRQGNAQQHELPLF
jgi:hypothetical protein